MKKGNKSNKREHQLINAFIELRNQSVDLSQGELIRLQKVRRILIILFFCSIVFAASLLLFSEILSIPKNLRYFPFTIVLPFYVNILRYRMLLSQPDSSKRFDLWVVSRNKKKLIYQCLIYIFIVINYLALSDFFDFFFLENTKIIIISSFFPLIILLICILIVYRFPKMLNSQLLGIAGTYSLFSYVALLPLRLYSIRFRFLGIYVGLLITVLCYSMYKRLGKKIFSVNLVRYFALQILDDNKIFDALRPSAREEARRKATLLKIKNDKTLSSLEKEELTKIYVEDFEKQSRPFKPIYGVLGFLLITLIQLGIEYLAALPILCHLSDFYCP